MDWVQILTIILAVLILISMVQRARETEEKGFWSLFIFVALIFIPFARVLGIL